MQKHFTIPPCCVGGDYDNPGEPTKDCPHVVRTENKKPKDNIGL